MYYKSSRRKRKSKISHIERDKHHICTIYIRRYTIMQSTVDRKSSAIKRVFWTIPLMQNVIRKKIKKNV